MAENHKIYQDRNFRLVSHRNVMIAVWSDAPTLPQVRILHREADQFAKQNPSGQAFVNLITGGVPVFTEAVRDELVKMIKSTTNFTLGSAHVLLVTGMTGSAVRAFMSTVMLLARPKAPNRVFATIADAVTWVHGRLGGMQAQWTGNELRDAIEEAKRDR